MTNKLTAAAKLMSNRFRGFLPVVVDVETAGFNAKTDALLEIAAVTVVFNEERRLTVGETYSTHIQPFPGANLDKTSLAFNGIDPHHPFRFAVSEFDALKTIFEPIRAAVNEQACTRAILVGHNPAFDLAFLNAAVQRSGIKRNPFHQFSTFDTVTLAGLAFGQTVLARAMIAAGIEWNNDHAHSAKYDAEKTAQLFCKIVNMWGEAFPGCLEQPL
ncbi:MAG: ribonuclease T [Gammaproteobacteria bacterium]|nr:ribonuclease T [Gammaproteobacteria bacterium]